MFNSKPGTLTMPCKTGPDQLITGLVTAENRKRPVCIGSVLFSAGFGNMWTGYGYGLRHWVPKDRTGPDFQALNGSHYALTVAIVAGMM
jgi:hypothetical protein